MSRPPRSSFAVWKLRFELAVQDPHTQGPRYHTTIFVETDRDDGSGFEHHVTGDVTSAGGMRYESRRAGRPEASSETLHSKEPVGYTDAEAYPAAWEALLAGVAPPPQQKAFNVATMTTEPFRTLRPLTFFGPGEERRPLVKCTEWVELRALPALREAALLWS